jgi:hypothetical protein
MFTFKTNKPTGKWRSFETTTHDIKLNKKVVGTIGDDRPHTIRLMVFKSQEELSDRDPCNWKWVTLAKNNDSLQDAKEWLNKNFEAIIAKFKLRQED